jgi:hypothetical protein
MWKGADEPWWTGQGPEWLQHAYASTETIDPGHLWVTIQAPREVPPGEFLYEPKWDGFRALVFRDAGEVDIRSRHGRPLARYFPELVEAFAAVPADTSSSTARSSFSGPRGRTSRL